jgi:hypothetical protein
MTIQLTTALLGCWPFSARTSDMPKMDMPKIRPKRQYDGLHMKARKTVLKGKEFWLLS